MPIENFYSLPVKDCVRVCAVMLLQDLCQPSTFDKVVLEPLTFGIEFGWLSLSYTYIITRPGDTHQPMHPIYNDIPAIFTIGIMAPTSLIGATQLQQNTCSVTDPLSNVCDVSYLQDHERNNSVCYYMNNNAVT